MYQSSSSVSQGVVQRHKGTTTTAATAKKMRATNMIAIPKRTTISDLVQHLVAAETAAREVTQQPGGIQSPPSSSHTQSIVLGGGGGRGDDTSFGPNNNNKTTAPQQVMNNSNNNAAHFPSNRYFWQHLRSTIAANPVASQQPPLFLVSDSVSRESLTVNQKFLATVVDAYEERGATLLNMVDGTAAPAAAEADDDGLSMGVGGGGDEMNDYDAEDRVSDANNANASFGMGWNASGSGTANHHTSSSSLYPHGASSSPPPPPLPPTVIKSSLITVTVTASSGQMRSFRAGLQFWDHVLYEYHRMLYEQLDETTDNSSLTSCTRKSKTTSTLGAASPASNSTSRAVDELALLREAQEAEADRIVLTVKTDRYDSRRAVAKLSGASAAYVQKLLAQSHKGGGGGAAGGLSADRLQYQHDEIGDTSKGVDGDEAGVSSVVDTHLKTVQMLVKEWREIVRRWDQVTEPLLSAAGGATTSSTTTGPQQTDSLVDHFESKEVQQQRRITSEGGRARSGAVVDPETTGDVVQEALQHMRIMEQRHAQHPTGGGAFWTHFMNHWVVLEAQYRNYL